MGFHGNDVFNYFNGGYPAEEKSGRLKNNTSRIHTNSWQLSGID
jgi:hypothetical protein